MIKNRNNLYILIVLLLAIACASDTKNKQESVKATATEKDGTQYKLNVHGKSKSWHDEIWELEQKIKTEMEEGTKEIQSNNELPEDFVVFYKKFRSDSLFQAQSRSSDFFGVISECDKILD